MNFKTEENPIARISNPCPQRLVVFTSLKFILFRNLKQEI
jgi:hypothetical protein